MLDLAAEWGPTSRLGCQVRVGPELDGLTVRVPASSLLSDDA
jgi:ferredoxin